MKSACVGVLSITELETMLSSSAPVQRPCTQRNVFHQQ